VLTRCSEILDQFRDEIEKRRKRNRDKENREERDRLRAEKAEDDARWANARRKRPTITEEDSYSVRTEIATSITSSSVDEPPPWPPRQGSAFASLASPSTSPSGPKTVWGTALIVPASPEVHAQHQHPEDSNADDGWLQSWEQELQAENELIAQAQAISLKGEGSSQDNVKPGGKKKKTKKITLMTTNARRAA